jgi:hypothetical protein
LRKPHNAGLSAKEGKRSRADKKRTIVEPTANRLGNILSIFHLHLMGCEYRSGSIEHRESHQSGVPYEQRVRAMTEPRRIDELTRTPSWSTNRVAIFSIRTPKKEFPASAVQDDDPAIGQDHRPLHLV